MSTKDLDLLELSDEQVAPFSIPDEATVRKTRLEIERHKRRLNEATPPRPYEGGGQDL